MRGRAVSTTALALLVAGCHGSSAAPIDAGVDAAVDRSVSDPRAAICAQVDAGAPVSFQIVQTIFDQNCITCHTRGDDLNLQAGASWADLVNQAAPATESCGGVLVVPGDPASSYLYVKLTSATPCYGSQMPRTSLFPNPLPDCVTALVGSWIAEGAPSQ
jgi:hypothetical protein